MIGNHRIGLLGQALLMLGVVPLPPPREPDLDMAAAEKAMRDLIAAGLDANEVLAAAGSPRRFVETAQKCLSMQAALAAQGQPSVDVARLLAQHDELIRERVLTRPALHGFEGLSSPREGTPAPRRPYLPLPAKPQPSAEDKRRAAHREARKSTRAAMQASLGAQALRGVETDYRTAKQERRAAKTKRKARRGW